MATLWEWPSEGLQLRVAACSGRQDAGFHSDGGAVAFQGYRGVGERRMGPGK